MSTRRDSITRELAGAGLGEFTSIYIIFDAIHTALTNLSNAIRESLRVAERENCRPGHFYPCVEATTSKIEMALREALSVYSGSIFRLYQPPLLGRHPFLRVIIAPSKLEDYLNENVQYHLSMAEGILGFLVNVAKARFKLDLDKLERERSEEMAMQLFPGVLTLLNSKGITPLSDESYFYKDAFKTLLEEALAHVDTARNNLSVLLRELGVRRAMLLGEALKEEYEKPKR